VLFAPFCGHIKFNYIRKKMVIIDTDCGVDDALALIPALKSPELYVKAITTVSGNVHVDKVIPNVLSGLLQENTGRLSRKRSHSAAEANER
jgi:hypothetical protein